MLFRRRSLGKYVFTLCLLWVVYAFIDKNYLHDTKKLEINEEIINKLVEKAKEKQNEIKKEENKNQINKKEIEEKIVNENKNKDDHDHPEEEKQKAEEQKKHNDDKKVQVNPPNIHENINAPGELGKPVKIDIRLLSPEEKKKYDEGWKNNAFNQYASDMISLHRTLSDVRDPACKDVKWFSPLPSTTVIVIFHNEAWSVLLRTVHSIIDRSDPNLLVEIILVDDFSDFTHLGKPLTDYMSNLGKVKILRATKREGLIRARLMGAAKAKGEILIFLDSHCECGIGWLEPLIDPIARNPNISTVPFIESIDDNTFEFMATAIADIQVGGFDWDLIFDWHPIPKHELERRKSILEPIRSPTMAGGLFAINRKYFELLGGYDPGMEIWGGENLEISFKVWMCGGELLCTPCSHVGHVFRQRSPYKWSSNVDVVKKNTVRLAEVWLDGAKDYFYKRLHNNLGDYGDVSERKKLRERLQCKTFDWYLKNIYPDQFIPWESPRIGEIKIGSFCMDGPKKGKSVGIYTCHGEAGPQLFILSKNEEIRSDEKCLDYAGGKSNIGVKEKVVRLPCHYQKGNQRWWMDDDGLIHHSSEVCLEMHEDKVHLVTNECDKNNSRQKWTWEKNPKFKQ